MNKANNTLQKTNKCKSAAAVATLVSATSLPPTKLYQPSLQKQHYRLNTRFSNTYQLVDQLGSGGYGFVMTAINRFTKQEVAVKFIYKKKLPQSLIHLKEPKEISILKRIHHPTVIDYIDSFEDDAFFYLVMEIFGAEWNSSSTTYDSSSSSSSPVTPNSMTNDDQFGLLSTSFSPPSLLLLPLQQQQQPTRVRRRSSCDLFECIEHHTKLSESQTHKIFKQIVQCVYDLSTIGIYHRDIKDENIVIDSDFNVKIIDFGSVLEIPADCSRDEFTIKKFHGTISFASPEILLGLAYRPEPAEVWSLGVLLFTLLYGQVPFLNSNQVISGNMCRPIQPKSSECMDLLSGLLKNNPHKRLSLKQILQHPWMASF